MEAARREEILSRIGAWLDAWPDGEPLPDGLDPAVVDAEEVPDLAGLAGAVLASSKEMQIQGRTFKRLEEQLAELPGLAEIHRRLGALETALAPRASGIALDDAIELHDRLSRSLAEARAAADRLPRLLRWGGAGRLLRSVLEGFALSVERLTDSLARAGIRPIDPDGCPFDARTMRAVDRVPADGKHAPGTVAETVRRGYVEGDHVLRFAEVRVAR